MNSKMVDLNLTIWIITLNVNGQNKIPIKNEDCQTWIKKQDPTGMLFTRDALPI